MQACGKIMVIGGQDLSPWSGKNAREHLTEEIADFIAATAWVVENNGLDKEFIAARIQNKLELYKIWADAQDEKTS